MGKLAFLGLVSVSVWPGSGRDGPGALAGARAAREGRAQVPIVFAENRGQCADGVRFMARLPGLVASVLDDAIVLELGGDGESCPPLGLWFAGAARGCALEGLEPRAARAHFLLGDEPASWIRDVPTFGRVRMRGLYPGIDLELHGTGGRLEYDLVLAPGADPGAFELELRGADGADLDADGALVARTAAGALVQLAPLAWQLTEDGERVPVACAWRARGTGRFSFACEAEDPDLALVVDPVLVHGTHVGGSRADEALGVFVDEGGEVYVTGWARSEDFPLLSVDRGGARRGKEGVVFKLASDGEELVYATYFGGRADDEGRAIRVDARGEALVVGTTESADFPAGSRAYSRERRGGSEAFVLRLSADGSSVLAATFLGGDSADEGSGLALASDGGPVLVGTTRSRDFPTTSEAPWRAPLGERDVFVARFDADLERLVFSTRLGGSEDDEGRALALDESDAIYVVGRTLSADFPVTALACDREKSSSEAFVAKLSGGRLSYATFLGGRGADEARAVAVDGAHRALVVGRTESRDFPATGGSDGARADGFAARLSESGHVLEFATLLGGAGEDACLGVALDPLGSPWIVGRTSSADFPFTALALESELVGAADAFLVNLEPLRGELVYATLLGGPGADSLCAAHLVPDGTRLALAGAADDIPPEGRGALGGRRRGPSDALVLRLDPRSLAASPAPPRAPAPVPSGASGE